MLSTNLNEMVKEHLESPPRGNDRKISIINPVEKRIVDIDKYDEQVTSKQSNAPPVDVEDGLIKKIKAAHERRRLSFMYYYYEIGRLILEHVKGKYGEETLKRISARTGVGLNTLYKACSFSQKYSRADYEMLFSGNIKLTWYQIAQNLKLEPDLLIETYRRCKSRAEFDENIVQMKSIGGNGG